MSSSARCSGVLLPCIHGQLALLWACAAGAISATSTADNTATVRRTFTFADLHRSLSTTRQNDAVARNLRGVDWPNAYVAAVGAGRSGCARPQSAISHPFVLVKSRLTAASAMLPRTRARSGPP